MELEKLEGLLEVEFSDQKLLETALTHRSANRTNNERLEYLGDAVLGLIVAETLYEMYPGASDGKLSRYRSSLVKGDMLAKIAREIGLGEYLRLGSGELKSGGFRRSSILADALESVIGAIYLDQGLETARATVERLYGDRISLLGDKKEHKDPKTRLQEYLQARQWVLPVYSVVETFGEPHEQRFVVKCHLADRKLVEHGEGTSRRRAEQDAAEKMLRNLSNE